jgi:hypothetical protein
LLAVSLLVCEFATNITSQICQLADLGKTQFVSQISKFVSCEFVSLLVILPTFWLPPIWFRMNATSNILFFSQKHMARCQNEGGKAYTKFCTRATNCKMQSNLRATRKFKFATKIKFASCSQTHKLTNSQLTNLQIWDTLLGSRPVVSLSLIAYPSGRGKLHRTGTRPDGSLLAGLD